MKNWFFFIVEAYAGVRRSPLMMTLAIGTITVSLLIFGLFLLISLNLNHALDYFSSKLEIRIYLNDTLTRPEIRQFNKRVSQMAHVKEVVFVDKETAWTTFKKEFPNLTLNEVLTKNPLPHSFSVKVSDNQAIITLSNYLKSFKEVEDVTFLGEIADRLEKMSYFSKMAGLVLVGMFTFTTLLIIMNTIRLTIIARSEEISIMKLVGATNGFIKGPFIFEGLFIGVVGSILSIIMLKGLYLYFSNMLQSALPYIPLVFETTKLNIIYASLFAVGTGLGLVGASISISKSLKTAI